MKFEMSNEEYNFVRKRLKRLEEAYNQTIDPSIRIAVKEQTCYELYERVPTFYDIFGGMLENCRMSSLKEITDITDKISESLEVGKLQEVDVQTAKKILKLKPKQLMLFLKAYNEAVKKEDLTYFSARQDNKFIFMTYKDGEFYGAVSDLPKEAKHKKSLCCFCH